MRATSRAVPLRLRRSGFALVLVVLGGCPTNAGTTATTSARSATPAQVSPRTCGTGAWAHAVDTDSEACLHRATPWLELTDQTRACSNDSDCVMVKQSQCDAIAVSSRHADELSRWDAPCWRAFDSGPAGGMCKPPAATCEDGCCNAY